MDKRWIPQPLDIQRLESPHFGIRKICQGCPHGKLVDDYNDVKNDLDEANYRCDLLADYERDISWGEDPLCHYAINEPDPPEAA